MRDFKETVENYLAKLDGEIAAASRITGCEWEWSGILRLEQICNEGKAMDFEANVSEEVKDDVEDQFHVDLDTFMARFDFQG